MLGAAGCDFAIERDQGSICMARCSYVLFCFVLFFSASMVRPAGCYLTRLFVRFAWRSTANVKANEGKSSGGPYQRPCGVPIIYLAHGLCEDPVVLVLAV